MAPTRMHYMIPPIALVAIGIRLWLMPAPAPATAAELAEVATGYVYIDRKPMAREVYAQALALDPNDYRANYGLGLLNYFEKRTPEAEQYLQKAIQLKPDDPEPKLTLGAIYSDRLDFGRAGALFSQVAKAHPENYLADFNLGLVDANLGNYQSSKNHLLDYLKKAPLNEPQRYRSTILLKQLDERLDAAKKRGARQK